VPKAPIYGGERHKVTLTRVSESIAASLVGVGKPFARLSDLVNDAIVRAYGSEEVKREVVQSKGLTELKDDIEELRKLREKHGLEEKMGKVLSEFYSIPLDQPVPLAAKVKADFQKHQTLCQDCEMREEHDGRGRVVARCPTANSGNACWRVKRQIALFSSVDRVLPALLVANEIYALEKKISQVELDFSLSEVTRNGQQNADTVKG